LQHRNRQIKNEQILAVSSANAIAAAEASKRIEQEKFLAMLTHELKTPLSVLLMAHTSKEGFSGYKNFVGDAITDMQNVLERCMLTDQFDSQALVLKIERCDLMATISKQISLYPQEHFSLQLGPYSSVMIQADDQLLRIVLLNLLDNAIKYNAQGQAIEISLDIVRDGEGEHARVRVANAPGMAGIPDPEKVFTKYYREPRAHARTGSGLGLYLIENLSRAMNGTLSYIPDAELVIFELKLPLAS
jgi:signal transduction histidine kinase